MSHLMTPQTRETNADSHRAQRPGSLHRPAPLKTIVVFFLALLFSLPLLANWTGGRALAAAVTNVIVSTDTDAAEAAAEWTFQFTPTTDLLGGAPEGAAITLEGPQGTIFPDGGLNYTVTVGESPDSVTAETVNVDLANRVTLSLPEDFSAAAGSSVNVVAAGVTNPAAGSYLGDAWTVTTHVDTDRAHPSSSLRFHNDPATAVSGVVVQTYNLQGGVEDAAWDIEFTTSVRGALRSNSQLETITVTAPEGTVFNTSSNFNFRVNGNIVNGAEIPESSSGNVVILTPQGDIGASAYVWIQIFNVTNPPIGTYDGDQFTVETSVDEQPTSPEQGITFGEAPAANVYLTVDPLSADHDAVWTWTFDATDGVFPADTVSFTGPDGSAFSADRLDYTVNGVVPTDVSGGGTQSVTLTLPENFPTVTDGGAVVVVARNTHNPPAEWYGSTSFYLFTTQNPTPGFATDSIQLRTSVHDVGFSFDTRLAETRTTWTVEFTTSPGGYMRPVDNIVLVAPPTTEFTSDETNYTVNGEEVDVVQIPDAGRGVYSTVQIDVPVPIAGGERVTVVAQNTQNPEAGTYSNVTFSAATTLALQASPTSGATFIEQSDLGVSDLQFRPQVTLPGVTTPWKIDFVTSRWGSLDSGDVITIHAPVGTIFSDDPAAYTINGEVVTDADASGGNIAIVTVPEGIAGQNVIAVVANGTTNPPRGVYAPGRFSVVTSKEKVPVSPAAGLAFHTPPVAAAGPDRVVGVGATVRMNGSGSFDPDGNPVTFAWGFDEKPPGSDAVLSGADTARPSFVADAAGQYVLRLVINDGFSDSAPDTVTINVEPRPLASFNYSPSEDLTTGTDIQFTDTSTAANDTITGWSWDFGDGTTSSAQQPQHRYDTPGVYHVYLQVTGENTGPSVRAHQVLLIGAPGAPIEGASYWTNPGTETIDTSHLTGLELTKKGDGTPVVTVASFDGQPVGERNVIFGTGSRFFDINLDSPDGVDAIEFTWTFGPDVNPADLILLWYDPEIENWRVVRDQTVNGSAGGGGTLEVHLDHTTSPRVDQLTGTVFGAGATGGITKVTDALTHGPNPASSSATFYFPSGSDGTLYVYDAAGRLVWSASVSAAATSRTWDLTGSGGEPLANGLYLYRLVREDGSTSDVGKLVVVR